MPLMETKEGMTQSDTQLLKVRQDTSLIFELATLFYMFSCTLIYMAQVFALIFSIRTGNTNDTFIIDQQSGAITMQKPVGSASSITLTVMVSKNLHIG